MPSFSVKKIVATDSDGNYLTASGTAGIDSVAVREQNLDEDGYINNSSHNFAKKNGDWAPFTLDDDDRLRIALDITTAHNELANLDYNSAGHIGFASDGDLATLSGTLQDQIDNIGSVFGGYATDITDNDQSSTSSESYIQKARLTTVALPSGRYRIGYMWEWRLSNMNYYFEAQVQVNDTDTVAHQTEYSHDTDSWGSFSGFSYYNGSGVLNIDIDYKTSDYHGTVYIRKARLEIWRVS